VIFTGNIGQAQGLDILPKTAEKLKGSNAKIKFIIVGDGREKENLLIDIQNRDVEEYFTIIPRQPAEKIPELLSCCDAAFISFMDNPLFANTIPAKLQSYMACGMPIVAAATGETKKIIQEAECGICVEIGDSEKLASELLAFAQRKDMKELSLRAKNYCIDHFDKKTLMDEMDGYLGE
jgi:glycosyltransferase involved in cell wall biosynthesis